MDYPKVKVCLDTSEDNLIDELYTPCLKWAERFDRGVGYFTTGWLTYNVAGLSDFASRGGKMRLITSPILSTEDTDAIIGTENQDGSAFLRLEAALLENVEILKQEMEADIINTFSWMLYDGIIDMRFAIPCEKLEEGDFHDKFGIFYKGNDALSFSGSINDSKHGFQNYESIKVFKTWAGTQEYVDADTARFEKISNNDTLLSEDGIKTLNAYALKGYRLITDYPLFDKPTSREEFLDAFNVAMQFYEKKDS